MIDAACLGLRHIGSVVPDFIYSCFQKPHMYPLLTRPHEQRKLDVAMRIILQTLPDHDRAYATGLHEAWGYM